MIKSLLEKKKMPLVMGILNATPDSFYAKSRMESAAFLEESGADIIDVGAESTRPGFTAVSEDEELRRLIPVVREIRRHSSIPISVDTRKGSVAKVALEEGADIINDVSAATYDLSTIEIVKKYKCDIILMHGVENIPVCSYLTERAKTLEKCGVDSDKIVLDPGFGFYKDTEQNIAVLNNLEELAHLGYPLLVGVSRKRFIGAITGRDVEDRLAGTLAVNALAAMRGADILRVHDVRETVDMLMILKAGGSFGKFD